MTGITSGDKQAIMEGLKELVTTAHCVPDGFSGDPTKGKDTSKEKIPPMSELLSLSSEGARSRALAGKAVPVLCASKYLEIAFEVLMADRQARIAKLEQLFTRFDADGSGEIDLAEFGSLMKVVSVEMQTPEMGEAEVRSMYLEIQGLSSHHGADDDDPDGGGITMPVFVDASMKRVGSARRSSAEHLIATKALRLHSYGLVSHCRSVLRDHDRPSPTPCSRCARTRTRPR